MRIAKMMAVLAGGGMLGLGLPGCESDSANEPGVGADVAGDWSGTYRDPGGSPVAVSATVAQNGRAVFIETSLPQKAHLLTGEINGRGDAFLTDAYDGETWTEDEPVTADHMRLIDFASGPGSSLRVLDVRK